MGANVVRKVAPLGSTLASLPEDDYGHYVYPSRRSLSCSFESPPAQPSLSDTGWCAGESGEHLMV